MKCKLCEHHVKTPLDSATVPQCPHCDRVICTPKTCVLCMDIFS